MEYVSNISKMLQDVSRFEYNERSLKKYKTAVHNVNVQNVGIKNSLKRISNDIENQIQLLNKMSDVLKNAASFYQENEKNIANLECKSLVYNKKNEMESERYQENTEKKEETGFLDIVANWKNLWKLVGNFGTVGSVVSGVGTIVQNQDNGDISDYISATKYFVSAIGTGASAVSKGGLEGARIAIGWNDALAKIDTSSFGNAVKSSIKKQADSLDFSTAIKTGDKIKTATKWAGYILTVASNGVENYNEYKTGQITAERAWAETGIESAVDIGLGIGATAIATGACVAFGIAAPPVALVGAAGTAIVITGNAVCKWVTDGRDIGEVIADKVCDGVESMGEFFNGVKDGVMNTFTASWKGICSAFS